jgi:hypothetical protein
MPFETPDLVPSTTEVPTRVDADEFTIRPLTVDDAARDYEAVTASAERIRGTFGPEDDWPAADLTAAQNRIDVAWHHKEFQRRDAFTYAVTDRDETAELGCVYVQPTRADYDAAVYVWVADSAIERGVDEAIVDRVRRWIADDWPFDAVAYPGRDIDWSEWQSA